MLHDGAGNQAVVSILPEALQGLLLFYGLLQSG
jgi:hypothetical protein